LYIHVNGLVWHTHIQSFIRAHVQSTIQYL